VGAVLVPLLERKRAILAGMAKERQKGGQGGVLLPANLPEATKETRDAVAAEIGARARVDRPAARGDRGDRGDQPDRGDRSTPWS
jgi:hypothetical protein